MPVVATITIITLLRGGGSTIGFLDPDALRDQCKAELEESDALEQAIALTDELDGHIARYDEAAAESIDAYIEESANSESSAGDLIKLLIPLDRTRAKTLHEIVRVRQSMLELLSDWEWDQVFS